MGCVAINLGTGRGYSVMDVVKGMEKACGRKIPYQVCFQGTMMPVKGLSGGADEGGVV